MNDRTIRKDDGNEHLTELLAGYVEYLRANKLLSVYSAAPVVGPADAKNAVAFVVLYDEGKDLRESLTQIVQVFIDEYTSKKEGT